MFDTFNLWYLWIALALDVATTWVVLERGGREANPIMRFLIERMGKAVALIGSHVGIGAIAWFYAPQIGPYPLWGLTAAYAFVVAWNARVIYQLRPR